MPASQEIFEKFLHKLEHVDKLAETTLTAYRRYYLGRFVRDMGSIPPAEWSYGHFEDFIGQRNWGPNSTRKFVHQCRNFIKWCAKRQYPVADFADGFRLPKQPRQMPKCVQWEVFLELLRVSRGLPLEIAVCCAGYLGLRRGEIVALKWEDIDWDAMLVRVYSRKTKRERHVDLHPDAAEILRRREGLRAPGDLVLDWPGFAGGINSGHRSLKRICRKHGLEVKSWHTLRHTVATRLIAGGATVTEVKDHLGHANISMTNSYVSATPAGRRAAVRRLNDPIARLGERQSAPG
ncbi:MAG: tyrosine-type recombinase/integrase [Planctomycetia bacterium]